MHGRMAHATFVIGHRFVVVAGKIVGVAELEQSSGMAGIKFDGFFQMRDRSASIAFGQVHAGNLKMIFGTVALQVFVLGKDRSGLGSIAFQAINAGLLQIDLAGRVASFFRFFECFQSLVIFLLGESARPR